MRKGQKMTPEQVEANRQRGLGRKDTPETRLKRSIAMKGRKYTEEHRRKISESRKAYYERLHLANPNYVKPVVINVVKIDPVEKLKRLAGSLNRVSMTMRQLNRENIRDLYRVRPRQSEETRKKISESLKGRTTWNKGKKNPTSAARKGILNPRWKGGVSSEAELIRKSVEYKNWRAEVFKRDKYTCVECGAMRTKENKIVLHADHIKPFATHPELRFDVSNGRVLCWACHKQTHSYSRGSAYQNV